MQNITSLLEPKREDKLVDAKSLRDVQRTAWLNNDYSKYFLAGLQDESDSKLTQAMNLATNDGTDLQIRRLLIEAKSLRDTIEKTKQNEHTKHS